MEENICPECKAKINDNMRICLKCGYPLDEKYATFKKNERKAIKQVKLIGLIVLGVLLITEIVMCIIGISYSSSMYIGIVILGLIVVCFPVGNIYAIRRENLNKEEERRKEEKEKERNLLIQKKAEKEQTLQNEWNQCVSGMGYNENDVIRVSFGNLVWVAKEKFCEAENSKDYVHRYLEADKPEHKIQIEEIPVKDIQYFSKEGDVQYTTRVFGGGGGGSSVGGAIVGGLIAGDAGVVIGSRKQTEAIKSEVVTHDSRKTIIRYYKENQIFAITYSGFSVYEYLLTKIPEKDLLTIQLNANKNSTSVKQVEESKKVITAAGNIKEKLETIKNLYDSGLITEEEYAKKKDDILSKI